MLYLEIMGDMSFRQVDMFLRYPARRWHFLMRCKLFLLTERVRFNFVEMVLPLTIRQLTHTVPVNGHSRPRKFLSMISSNCGAGD